ncbi:T-cell ecto-ADP-ribosyltransferase 1-like [Mixophyes fleayi]|uniref:T-cell ecto-ADP-ribosyltransferase 1-like n=1 Tax=Mixophyes fleayi TaxID=3061075 RepID=UPI003F4DDB74
MKIDAAAMTRLVGTFLIFCVLIIQVTSQEDGHDEILDLAEDVFDDGYLGCRKAMKKQIEDENILNTEKAKIKYFKRAWEESEKIWSLKKKNLEKTLPEGFMDYHGVALVAYTGFIRKEYNKALKSAGKSYRSYMDNFHYKSLHYYLTIALQLLSQDCRNTTHVSYFRDSEVFYKAPSRTGYVKFGNVLDTFSDHDLENYNESLCIVYSCSGVHVDRFSQFPGENEVLVPGYEVFTASDEGEHMILTTTRKHCSNYNCAYVRGENSKLPVEQCIYSASPGRMYRPVITALLSVLIAAVVSADTL